MGFSFTEINCFGSEERIRLPIPPAVMMTDLLPTCIDLTFSIDLNIRKVRFSIKTKKAIQSMKENDLLLS